MTDVKETHTIDEALSKFQLVSGAGDGKTTACVMTALSWVVGAGHTDATPCAHPTLRSIAIRANDGDATPEQRASIVKAGETGLLDTWWIPGVVIALEMAAAAKDNEHGTVAHCLDVLARITAWKTGPKPPANLYGANLYGADLYGANLRSANLRSADLSSADLSSANLRSANLRSANLRSADLSSANLRSADLRSADLRSADLSSANLYGANLRSARGNEDTALPAGWKVAESGLIVKAD